MTMIGKQADFLHGIPVVSGTTLRDLLFPAPDTNQRVHNLGTGYIERYTGAVWAQEIPVGNTGQSVNLLAVGGVASASVDNATAIQGAINTVSAAGGGVVWIPAGSYGLGGSGITLPNGVALVGDGMIGKTNLVLLSSFSGTAAIRPAAMDSTQESVTISNLSIDSVTNTPNVTRAVLLLGAMSVATRVSNILIFGVRGAGVAGILCTDNAAPTSGQYLLDNIWVNIAGLTGDGFVVEHQGGGGGIGDLIVTNLAAENATGTAKHIWIHGSNNATTPGINDITLLNVHVESTAVSAWFGLYVDGVRGLKVNGFSAGVDRAGATFINITNSAGNVGYDLVNLCNPNFAVRFLNDAITGVLTDGGSSGIIVRYPDSNLVGAGAFGGGSTVFNYNRINGETVLANATTATAFQITNPTNPIEGQRLTYDIYNTSGGAMGAVTFDTQFKIAGAFTTPANTKHRLISFVRRGGAWRETWRSTADLND